MGQSLFLKNSTTQFHRLQTFVVPIPEQEVQERLVAETKRRRLEARRLRQEAETEWDTAKTHFEQQLLGEEG